MNKEWPLVPLKEVLTERLEVPPMESLENGDIPIISKVGFNDGQIQLRTETSTKTDMILVRPGDLVISGINAAKGAIAIYSEESAGPIAATIHYSTYIPNKERVNTVYLWRLLRSLTFRNILLMRLPGGLKTELSAKKLLSIAIALPSIEEQGRIVSQINKFVAQIEAARSLYIQRRKALEKLIESCIGDITTRFSELGRFAEVITFNPRSGPSFPTDPDWNGMPVLMPSSVTGFKLDTSKVEFGPGNESISQKDLLLPGDILIARGNKREQVGNAGVVLDKAEGWVCANLLMRLQVDMAKVDPYFCIYWLRSPYMRNYVKQNMTGTNPNIQKINQQIILNFPFPSKVPLGDQRRIVAYLDDLQAKADALKRLQAEAAAELDVLLPAVLDQAFRGEL